MYKLCVAFTVLLAAAAAEPKPSLPLVSYEAPYSVAAPIATTYAAAPAIYSESHYSPVYYQSYPYVAKPVAAVAPVVSTYAAAPVATTAVVTAPVAPIAAAAVAPVSTYTAAYTTPYSYGYPASYSYGYAAPNPYGYGYDYPSYAYSAYSSPLLFKKK